MPSSSSGRGGARPGAGRRPKYRSPMPRSAFTARPDHIIFYLLLSGNEKTVSAGVQTAVSRLVAKDKAAAAKFEQAKWMTDQAERELVAEVGDNEEVTQDAVLRHVLEHRDRLSGMWQESQK